MSRPTYDAKYTGELKLFSAENSGRPRKSNVDLETLRSNIELFKRRQGVTQRELAEFTGLQQGTISKILSGLIVPSDSIVRQLALALQVPVEALYKYRSVPDDTSQVFRRRTNVRKSELESCRASALIAYDQVSELLRSLELDLDRCYELKQLVTDLEPVDAAITVREFLGITSPVISNLTAWVESLGIVVMPMRMNKVNIDGFLFPDDRQPMIFLKAGLPGDRQRFTLAHELGHFLLHGNSAATDEQTQEFEANQFAAELLMPAKVAKSQLRQLRFNELEELKRIWKTSMQMIIVRAKNLQAISENQAYTLHKKLSVAGWKLREPSSSAIPAEKPTIVKQLLKYHQDELNYSTLDFCRAFEIDTEEFQHMYGHLLSDAPEAPLRIVK